MKRSLLLFCALSMMLLPALALKAQVTTGVMNGLITDKAGKPLTGVRVTATHEPSGSKYGAVTNTSGRYLIPGMRTGGPYTVQASAIGMKAEKYNDIYVKLGDSYVLNVKLDEGEVKLSEITVVSKKNAVMASERTGAATNIGREVIQTMPTLNRNVQDMTRMTPQANGFSIAGQDPRFVNFSVDGSVFNNNFGLQGAGGGALPGAQTNSTPISLDAIEELQVNIAPYDVRQGGFVGAGINAITRKGDNEFRASAFYNLRNQRFLGDSAKSFDGTSAPILAPLQVFDIRQYGFRFGGPIVQDKLFFFVNGEIEDRTDPATTNVASNATTPTGLNVVRPNINLADSLNRLKAFLIDKFQYDPGVYQGYNFSTFSAKATARLDYNIDESQKVSVRFNYLRSYRDIVASNSGSLGSRNNINALNFSGNNYRQNNDVYSAIAEYNGTFNSEWFVNATVGFTANRDYRSLLASSRFPLVDIIQGGNNITSFGDEPFTPNNKLDNDTYQVQLNLTRYLGDHILTAGANFEGFTFVNGFTPEISGVYQFNSFTDFYNAVAGQNVRLNAFRKYFSALPGGAVPFARTEASQIGFYLQDEWSISKQFKITLGVRADVTSFGQTALANPEVAGLTFNGERFNTDKLPLTNVLFSPRFGFNWDVTGERTTQIRGGAGIFTGRVPFVVISNQVGNTGMYNGAFSISGAQLNVTNLTGTTTPVRWSTDLNANIPADASTRVPPASYGVAVSSPNFKYPQVFRANFAIDQELPLGIIGTVEGIFSQNLNAVLYRNANLNPATGQFVGPDNRPRFPGSYKQSAIGAQTTGVDSANRGTYKITDVTILDNTSQGNSYSITGQLQKRFDFGLNLMAAYTYSQSTDLANFGSIAFSSWRDALSIRGNNSLDLSYSSNDLRNRFIASVGYTLNWADVVGDAGRTIGKTSINLFLQAQNQNRGSFTIRGDMNGDGVQNNDIMFVPQDQTQIAFNNLVIGTRTFDATAQWNALDAYIKSNAYLESRRGQYTERNGYLRDILTQLDLSLTHEIMLDLGKPTGVQFRLDVFNVLNVLDKSLGVAQVLNMTNPLQYNGVTTDGRPRYILAGTSVSSTGNLSLLPVLRGGNAIADVWQMQFGIRVTFN